jgi:GxxExxY protein
MTSSTAKTSPETRRSGEGAKIENALSKHVIDAAVEVHKTLGGPGLLESLYEDALAYELRLRQVPVQSQVRVPIQYKGYGLRDPMRIDLLVGSKVIVEVKATEKQLPVHKAQVLTYLRLTGLKLGLLINFGQGRVLDGIHRVVNGF